MRRGTGPALALAALLLLVGCGRDGATRGATGTRIALLLSPGERPFWLPIAEAFERANPGVEVDLTEGPQSTDLRENLYTASLLAQDPTFDLVYLDVTWTAKFAAAGWLLPLEDRFTEHERAGYLPEAIGAGWVRGHLYRIPVRTDMGLLYWREDWLKEAGYAPPTTFDDLLATARALSDPPRRWGYVWQGKQYEGLVCDYLEVARGFGGYWIDPATGAVGLDEPGALRAALFLRRCLEEGVSPPGVATYQEEESRRLFHDGRAVFLRNWPYVWRLSGRADSPIRGRVGVGSMVHAPGGRPAGTLGGWGLAISRYSRSPEIALGFIRFATSLAAQRLLCAESGYAPARIESYADSILLAANPFLTTFRALHRNAVARPTIPEYARASDILQRHLSAAVSGTVPVEAALRAAARETRLLLRRSAADDDPDRGRS